MMIMKRLIAVILVAMQVALPGVGWGATYYVAPYGSNTAPYDTWEKAARTFKTANTAATTGDNIILSAGQHVITGFVGVKSVFVYNHDQSDDYLISSFVFDPSDTLSRLAIGGTSPSFTGLSFLSQPHNYGALEITGNTGPESTVVIDHCYFAENGAGRTTKYGGAVASLASTNRINLNISDSVFYRNQSPIGGGAVAALNNVFLTSVRNQYLDNFTSSGSAAANGGGVYLSSSSALNTALFTGDTFDGNKSGHNGGALFAADVDTVLTDVTVINNESNWEELSLDGSAALSFNKWQNTSSTMYVTIEDSFVDGNFSHADFDSGLVGDGGGFMAFGLNPTNKILIAISDTTFSGNFANQGAGAYVSRYADATFDRVKFLSNTSYMSGGGSMRGGANADCEGDTSIYRYCLFSGNKTGYNKDGSAGYYDGISGGLGVRVYSRVDLINSSFLNNWSRAGTDGDAIGNGVQSGGTTFMTTDLMRSTLQNVLVWNDTGIGSDVLIYSGDNGWTEISESAYPDGQTLGSGIVPTGIVNLTTTPTDSQHAPVVVSPVINAGAIIDGIHDQATPATDINGTNVLTIPDIGAYEYPGGLYFNAASADGGNGTRQYPYNAWTDYVWTGYNLRTGAEIYLQGDMTGTLDLSGLTDTGAITVKSVMGKPGSITGFIGNGPDTKFNFEQKRGLYAPLWE